MTVAQQKAIRDLIEQSQLAASRLEGEFGVRHSLTEMANDPGLMAAIVAARKLVPKYDAAPKCYVCWATEKLREFTILCECGTKLLMCDDHGWGGYQCPACHSYEQTAIV